MNLPPAPPNAKHCPDFPGYAVTTTGDVYSCWRTNSGLGKLWKKRKTHWVATREGGVRYEQITLSVKQKPFVTFTHRLVLLTYRGPCPTGCESRHLDGDSLNNDLKNLMWGTKIENSDDKRQHGTLQAGARNGQAKLTEKDVAAIRRLRSTHTLSELATRFRVSRSQIKRIVYNKSWKS
jgi:hypothetical protein